MDDAVHQKWQQIVSAIELLNNRTSDEADPFPVSPGSRMAVDDTATRPLRESVVLRTCLNTAVDHLHALKVLVADAGMLHLAAPFTLVRGALESVAAATWIVGADERDQRIQRTLRWYAQDVVDAQRAQRIKPDLHRNTDKDHWALLDGVADRNKLGRSYRTGYRSTDIVKAAEAALPQLPLGVHFPWQLCSAFAHGRPWAVHGATAQLVIDNSDPDTITVQHGSTLEGVLYPTMAAVDLIDGFLNLHARLAAP